MTTYYVKTDGNDSLNGLTWANAWLTVNKAATTATGGDTVYYADGTYDIGAGQATWNNGSAGNLITHQALNHLLAIWEQSATGGANINLNTHSYLAFDHLRLKGDDTHTQTGLVSMVDSANITLENCELGDSTRADYGAFIRSCNDIAFYHCTIHPNNAVVDTEDGIHIERDSSDITVMDTEIYNCAHEGISCYTCDGLLIDNCYVHHTGSHGIGIGDSPLSGYTLDDVTIRDCVVHDIDTTYNYEGRWTANIRIHQYASNVTVLRNTLYNSSCYGIYLASNLTGPIHIYNNTLYNHGLTKTSEGEIVFDDWELDDNIEDNIYYKNNIVFVTQVGPKTFQAAGAFTAWIQADYNLYYSSTVTKSITRGGTTYTSFADYKTAGYEPNTIIDDNPDFIDAANADFTLQGGSPAINEGTDIGESYYGPAPDIGAHEYTYTGIICTIT